MKTIDLSKQINDRWDNTYVQCVRSGCSTSEAPAICPFSERCYHATPHKVKRCKASDYACLYLGVRQPGFCSLIPEVEVPSER